MNHIPPKSDINQFHVIEYCDETKSYLVECRRCHTEYQKTEYQIYDKNNKCDCSKSKIKMQKLPAERIVRNTFKTYRTRARSKKIAFKLTTDDIRNLIFSPCYYCMGAPGNMAKSTGHNTYGGIDRIDSSKGYELDNCVPCCWTCNKMKGTLEQEEFLSQCHLITQIRYR